MENSFFHVVVELTPSQIRFALCALVLILAFPLYQIFFHPLAKYPGPLTAKLSIVRATYYAWKGETHIDVWRLHEKYGPIVRYGPNWLVFNSVEGYKDIYSTNRNVNKHSHFSGFNPRAANLFSLYDKKEHSQRRRCLGVAFSEASIRQFEDKLLVYIGRFCDQICPLQREYSGKWNLPVNISDWAAYLILDALTEFLFSTKFNLLKSEQERYMVHHIQEHSIRLAVCTYMPVLGLLKIDRLICKSSTTSTRIFWRWMKKAIAARAQRNVELNDAFEQIKLSRKSEASPMLGIQSETALFLVAGMDTTTSALCAVLFYLSRNEQAYNRLCSEIRGTFQEESQISYAKLKSCIYLYACIEEALRMSPSAGAPPWREVGVGGEIIAGHDLPQGCSVGTGIYSMHHTDAYFERPHDFLPERWISDQEGDLGKLHNPAFMAFSTGPRSCIGKSLSHFELLMTVAVLVWRCDLRVSTGPDANLGAGKEVSGKKQAARENPGEFQLHDWVVGHPRGPVLQFRYRDADTPQT